MSTTSIQNISQYPFMVMDWGSTNIRAFGFADGKLVYQKRSDQGVSKVQGQDCVKVFADLTHDFFSAYGSAPAVLSGMVGSINGWSEAAYLKCPIDLAAIKQHLHVVNVQHSLDSYAISSSHASSSHDADSPHCAAHAAYIAPSSIHIVPGLSIDSAGNSNVMRGEETQLLGALNLMQAQGKELSLCIMPGTHSKWVHVENGVVNDFRTVMTGELLSVLLKHSLLGMPHAEKDEESAQVFTQGLEQGLHDDTLLVRLFEVRGAMLLNKLKREHVKEFLSGLLIGSEVRGMLEILGSKPKHVVLIANNMLNERYAQALSMVNIESSCLDGEQAFLAGICPLVG